MICYIYCELNQSHLANWYIVVIRKNHNLVEVKQEAAYIKGIETVPSQKIQLSQIKTECHTGVSETKSYRNESSTLYLSLITISLRSNNICGSHTRL